MDHKSILMTETSPIDLTDLARQSMIEYGLLPDFPLLVAEELKSITAPAKPNSVMVKDMRNLLWFSLDNDDSRDLDQLTYAETTESGFSKIYVAIADVDSLVKKNSAIDAFAEGNTTSIYTPTKIFTMLPEKLSTDFTSLNPNEDRLAVVVEVEVTPEGEHGQYAIHLAYVRNYAKLAYNATSDWLDGKQQVPDVIKENVEIQNQIRLQDEIAHRLRDFRHKKGSLTLETIESVTVFHGNQIADIKQVARNRGRDLIEDFMIAANSANAKFLYSYKIPSLRRVVRVPKRWDRIVELAMEYGEKLPTEPNAKALDEFLMKRRKLDPLHFPDLSLTVIKLLGNGEYVVEYPGEKSIGHFSLAVRDYTHSTAPNRRFPDLITQRMIKSVILKLPNLPYTTDELEKLAKHCTQKEDDAEKVERRMKKSAAALLLSSRINEKFDALVTGISSKGTWVRLLQVPVEGKLVKNDKNIDIGDKIRVKLVHVDVEKGFIDLVSI